MSDADSARPIPLRGRNGPSECSSRGDDRLGAGAVIALGVAPAAREQRLVERGGLEDLALQRRGGGEQARVDVRERLREALPVGTLEQGGRA